MVQHVELLPVTPAPQIKVLIRVLTTLLAIQLPTNAPEKIAEDDASPCAPSIHLEEWDGVRASDFRLAPDFAAKWGMNHQVEDFSHTFSLSLSNKILIV